MDINNKEEFVRLVLGGSTVALLQTLYECSRGKIYDYKRKHDAIGLTPNSNKQDIHDGFKICKTCKNSKSLNDFYTNGRNADNSQKFKPSCRLCENSKNMRVKLLRYIKVLKTFNREYKCERCGYDDNYAALEFHHINPKEKNVELSRVGATISEARLTSILEEELPNIEILCANCHREYHNNGSSKSVIL